MGVVYVKHDCVVRWSQGQSPLVRGEVWDDSAELVAERPDLFDTEPTLVKGRPAAAAQGEMGPVETATAAPGEKRPRKLRGS
ncbi:hypothetical protein FHS43_000566 [Streptosporangium becharense]|uniref:Uncharacterized protein n=1 Tax=Streptosporangium becharense TaxID=1816182 RepID=A0A7W9IN26_9ACTN|nr:hypothetical protein [Streptosporangium becharense]MBB2909320.1 hypothetical protein [Streptosporangium becharense]MBB5823777.1 hypothetical protein [Streptosporangium becharense]